ncbi:radical SAM peptide maturase, CXXX-repeat target family [Clostridium senegalense]|uniref:Radical SAM peptide maturase, CXXX-repeat target family n=1 Tax=Clostridium senegalense TaxID=1465809 RepID=A0A6M0H4H3_9CLOT|nr:radical SAM peptide maturase, CXXX-repeat target family [Clostridium senegalense]NEU05134.1 radical SAM peptide maturase, CXXX-repeat target family [Clostridium senegalense]
MENSSIKMGQLEKAWRGFDGNAKTITFSVTEDCNLRCKYCYMSKKNNFKKMSFDTAKKAVDYILNDRKNFNSSSVVWDFIGGEPLLEINLIDKISDYIKQQMFLLDHPWFNSYRFSISTNGLLYDSSEVQRYIEKNRNHISIGISVDGNKTKHDMQRVFPNDTGSYDEVVKRVPLWLKQFPKSETKATFAHDDLPYIKDSVISLWNLGIKTVSANVIFEDVWEQGDDDIFEAQLKELADYIIENKFWNEYSVRFFDPKIGFPIDKEAKKSNFCGAGKMLAISADGKYYPCIRFVDFTLNNKTGLCIGDVDSGINYDKLRPFSVLSLESQSPKECVDCDVASGCAWCTGFNYDSADTNTVYQRATFICKMHKANVRANKYFWKKFENITGIESERKKANRTYYRKPKYLQIMMSDNVTPHCGYRNLKSENKFTSDETLNKAFKFAKENDFDTVILGKSKSNMQALSIIGSEEKKNQGYNIIVYDNNSKVKNDCGDIAILLVNKDNIDNINNMFSELCEDYKRINLILENIEEWGKVELEKYKMELEKLKENIIIQYKDGLEPKLNILTDRMNREDMCNCTAGEDTFALAPNGKIYICPAFYYDNPENFIGDLEKGINIKNNHLMKSETAGICQQCDAYQCRNCKYLNKKLTNEYNIPSKIQCTISHLERNMSREIQNELVSLGVLKDCNLIPKINYLDPLEKISKKGV